MFYFKDIVQAFMEQILPLFDKYINDLYKA